VSKSLIRGSAALAIADFSKKALLAVTVLLCARFVPKAIFGDYMFLMSFYQIFSVIAGAGLPNILIRHVARDREWIPQRAIGGALVRLMYAVPAILCMGAVFFLGGYSRVLFPALASLALLIVLRAMTENAIALFQGREDPVTCAKISFVQSFITLATTAVVCFTTKELLHLVLCHVLGAACSTLYAITKFSSRRLPLASGITGSLAVAKALIYETPWINGATLVSSAYNRCDVLLLQRLASPEAVATYSAPYRILDLAQIIPTSVMGIVLPKLCRVDGDASDRVDQNRLLFVLLCAALLLIVVSTLLAPWIVPLILGKSYVSSVVVVELLIWATPFMFWNYLLLSNLIANHAERYIFFGSTIALAANLAANLLLIPQFGYMAAAFNTILTELMLLGTNVYFCKKANIFVVPAWSARILASAAGVLIGSLLWRTTDPHLQCLAALILLASPLLMLAPMRSLSTPSEVEIASTR
jgi:O-antigen/teichoic acid export membrane protein